MPERAAAIACTGPGHPPTKAVLMRYLGELTTPDPKVNREELR